MAILLQMIAPVGPHQVYRSSCGEWSIGEAHEVILEEATRMMRDFAGSFEAIGIVPRSKIVYSLRGSSGILEMQPAEIQEVIDAGHLDHALPEIYQCERRGLARRNVLEAVKARIKAGK